MAELPHADANALLASTSGAPIVFLDYDGTLAPIVDQPEKAFISEETRAALTTLAASRPVAIVSGRSNEKLQSFLGLDSLYFAGSHGVNIVGPSGEHVQGPDPEVLVGKEALAALDVARAALDAALGHIPGYLTENNVFCITAHYRMVAPEHHELVRETVERVLAEHSQHLVRKDGKMVHELRPAIAWDKGKAVEWLLKLLRARHRDSASPSAAAAADGTAPPPASEDAANGTAAAQLLPIYLGDDVADEDAFRAVARAGGVGIKVAQGPVRSDVTAATCYLPQSEVCALLHDMSRAQRA